MAGKQFNDPPSLNSKAPSTTSYRQNFPLRTFSSLACADRENTNECCRRLQALAAASLIQFQLEKKNDPVHLFWMLYRQASRHTKHRTPHTFNKLTSVFLCVCPLIEDKLRHNIVNVAVEPRAAVFYNNKTRNWSNTGNK